MDKKRNREPDDDGDSDKEQNEKKRLKSSGDGICCVCEDDDPTKVQNMYGATSVCFACRNFFRTCVNNENKTELKCIRKNPVSRCPINKSTRKDCKFCRYQKCLSVGMKPLLVDRRKNKISRETTISCSSEEASRKEKFLKTYEETYRLVMLEPNGVYLTSQASLEDEMVRKPNACFHEKWKKIVHQVVEKFLLQHTQTRLKKETIKSITAETHMAMFSLHQALKNCFDNKNILEQFSNAYHFPKVVLDLLKDECPYTDTEEFSPFKPEEFEIKTTAATQNQEDDDFLESTKGMLFKLMQGDQELGRIFALIVMFTPCDVELTNEESLIFKEFQSQVSMIMFSHIMSQEEETFVSAFKRCSDLASIVKDIFKCGLILKNRM